MINYIIRRLFIAMFTLVGITVVTFCITRLAPGDPAMAMTAGVQDPKASAAAYEQLRERWGLDKPIYMQYFSWVKGMAVLDFGESMSSDSRPVIDKIRPRLWPTMSLALLAIGLSLSLSIPIGIWSAAKQNSYFDTITSTVLYALYSVPSYVMAVPLILLLGVKWDILPFQGMMSDNYDTLSTMDQLIDIVKHYAMITFCFSYGAWAYYARFVRQNMLEVVRQDYIRTARAKGVQEFNIILKHAFRNTLIPIVTLLGLILPEIIGGSVILEVMFNWPGIGRLFFDSMMQRDYTTIMAISTSTAVLVLVGTLISDLSYVLVDPRVSYE